MTRKQWIAVVLGTPFTLWVALEILIFAYGLFPQLTVCDCIIVLGTRSLADGTPGPSLTARCDWAAALWKNEYSKNVICTGGLGADGTVESEASRNYLSQKGIPKHSIKIEKFSHNTRENFLFAKEIMQEHNWKSCLVVTDPFHELRSVWTAEQLNLDAYPAPTYSGPSWNRYGTWIYYQMRESGSMLKFAFETASS
jgi:uncharacterized SAM-binding protein YcdF (DUF218 family)